MNRSHRFVRSVLLVILVVPGGVACSRAAPRGIDSELDAGAQPSDVTPADTTAGTAPRVWTPPPPAAPPPPPPPPPPLDSEGGAPPPSGTAPADATITLARTACFGSCPVYKVALGADGRVSFEGYAYVRAAKGERRIAAVDAQKIFASLASTGFWGWNDKYRIPITDQPTATITVRWGGRSKTVSEYPPCDKESGAPPELCTLGKTLDRITRSDEWTKCKDANGRAVACVAQTHR